MNRSVFAVVAAGIFLSACSGTSHVPAPTPTPGAALSSPAASVSPVFGEQIAAKSFTVIGGNYSFEPKEIKVKQGDVVKIIFQNNEGFHDWKVDEFSAATKRIKAGEQDSITFTADKAGTFEYYCSVGSHRAMGMVGKLIVE